MERATRCCGAGPWQLIASLPRLGVVEGFTPGLPCNLMFGQNVPDEDETNITQVTGLRRDSMRLAIPCHHWARAVQAFGAVPSLVPCSDQRGEASTNSHKAINASRQILI